MTAKEQSEWFIQIARELDADESGTTFDAFCDSLLTKKDHKLS